MPIYAYKCESCGHRQDVLQKISDPVLTQCPACGAATFAKQVTAAGFQLKGSGWYVTDFRDGAKAKPEKAAEKAADGAAATEAKTDAAAKPAEPAKSEAAPAPAPAPKTEPTPGTPAS
jgi:putative FmdB family regulatory protein